LIDRLLRAAGSDGEWGYRSGTAGSAESTAMVCLALDACGVDPKRWAAGLGWLAKVQREDGRVPITAGMTSPAWTTGLAVLAWRGAQASRGFDYERNVEKAVGWLLGVKGMTLHSASAGMLGHDMALAGWPWVRDTHSWVEPTSYAVLALRAVGKADHPRTREAVRLLVDRTLPDGGWNYGNTRVFDKVLRPFPVTSGIALMALAGESSGKHIEQSIAYLERSLERVRSPLSLGWGLLGLTAWRARPGRADDWLAECATRTAKGQPNNLQDALLLLASVKTSPFIGTPAGAIHG
jgi:hypothetical protein